MKQRIILASASQSRKNLLEMIGLEFEVVKSSYKESSSLRLRPNDLVRLFAEGKASEVASRIKSGIVIGVDTIISVGNTNLGKPKNEEDAFRMLKKVSGKKIKVYSGLAIINTETGQKSVTYEETDVKMHRMKDEEIRAYIKTGEPMGKSGSLAIEGLGSIFVSRIEGCYFNIIGLPVHCLFKSLEKFGVNLFEFEKWKNKCAFKAP